MFDALSKKAHRRIPTPGHQGQTHRSRRGRGLAGGAHGPVGGRRQLQGGPRPSRPHPGARSAGGPSQKPQPRGQQVVKITNEELTTILGGGVRQLEPGPHQPSVILIVGLNGSGKTTTAAKLARDLKQSGQLPVLVAADLRRPAAVQQLEKLGQQVGVTVYEAGTCQKTVEVAKDGIKRAAEMKAAWAIVDTAGRFQIDGDLMSELEEVKTAVSPAETLLVVDAMTGQDAVNAAQEFHQRIGLTGLILTKLDGDARGGAALSITAVTGVPIKFIGTGERTEALERFHPDRLGLPSPGHGRHADTDRKGPDHLRSAAGHRVGAKIPPRDLRPGRLLGPASAVEEHGASQPNSGNDPRVFRYPEPHLPRGAGRRPREED